MVVRNFQVFGNQSNSTLWETLKGQLWNRFGPTYGKNFHEALSKVRLMGTLHENSVNLRDLWTEWITGLKQPWWATIKMDFKVWYLTVFVYLHQKNLREVIIWWGYVMTSYNINNNHTPHVLHQAPYINFIAFLRLYTRYNHLTVIIRHQKD